MFALKSAGSRLSLIAGRSGSLQHSVRCVSRAPRSSDRYEKSARFSGNDQQFDNRRNNRSFRERAYESPRHSDDAPRFNSRQQSSREIVPRPEKSKPNNGLVFTKSEQSSNDFRKLMLKLSVRKHRDELKKIVLEGKRLINDAIDANVPIDSIYYTSDTNLSEIKGLEQMIQEKGTQLVKVLYKDMKLFSSLVTSPGCMAVAHRPNYDKASQANNDAQLPVTVICDNVRDPGNMGTIIRSAAASGVQQLIASHGSCDIWNSKVIKSSSGAHFRLPIYESTNWDDLSSQFPSLKDSDFYLADSSLKPDSKPYSELSVFDSDRPRNKVLIVCNEAHGPSSHCEAFIHKLSPANFTRIHIPLLSNVESINSAIAASVFMFEFRKQFSQNSSD